MPTPTAQQPSLFQRGLNFIAPVAPLAPFIAPVAQATAQSAAKVGATVLGAANNMAAPVLANPIVNRTVTELGSLMAAPATRALAWGKAFETVGSNMITAWGVNSNKHDWNALSTAVEAKPLPTDVKTVNPAVKGLVDTFPSLGKTPEQLAQLQELSQRLTPEQIAAVSKRLETFKTGASPSTEFKEEVAGQLLADLANPLRADNACGPTCSSASAQVRMARDKPAQYAEIVLDMAQGGDHQLATGKTIKATYTESTVKSMRPGNGSSATGILFQANLQHFAASNVSMGGAAQKVFNPLFNGGLDKLFSAVDPGISKDLDNFIVNKDFDRFNPQGGARQIGHDPAQMEFLQQNLFPGAQTKSWLTDSPNDMWSAVEKDLKGGKSVSASVYNPKPDDPAHRFHVVTILGVDHAANPPQVKFHTWGGERTISLDDFKKSCTLVAPGGN